MRILHLCDQNWVGTASTFVKMHRRFGHESRMVTLAQCAQGYDEDICLHLPFVKGTRLDMRMKDIVSWLHRGRPKWSTEEGLRVWKPRSPFENVLFRLRDRLWERPIYEAIERYDLLNYDIYHLESGIGFFRDCRILKELKRRGKKLVCYYLGTDLRERGLIPEVDALSDFNLTCEFDHLALHSSIQFFYMPFETERFQPKRQEGSERVRVCHAPRNRRFKGSDIIIRQVKELERDYPVELVLIEGRSHQEALETKMTCDIAIDQVGDMGGVGYGVNSLETLSMEIATCTEMREDLEAFMPDHPFINVNRETLKQKLIELVEDRGYRERKGKEGRGWVVKYHDAASVVSALYGLYRDRGWMP
ncbi:MAG: glycosyltransferase [Candidatus Eisenbacteria sp.]|nr:glycosyltransferase [Candidatus Eisenbacteria bacterium]